MKITRTVLNTLLIAAWMTTLASAQAEARSSVGGNFRTTVSMGALMQRTTGIGLTTQTRVSSVKHSRIGGNVRSDGDLLRISSSSARANTWTDRNAIYCLIISIW